MPSSNWLADLVTQLHTDNVGTLNTDIFTSTKSALPRLTTATLQIVETGGSSPDATHNSDNAYQRPAAQLTTRGDTYALAYAMARAAYASLVAVKNKTINSTWYLRIQALNEPRDAGVDPVTGQARCQFNVIGQKRPS